MKSILIYIKNKATLAGLLRVLEQLEQSSTVQVFLCTDDSTVEHYSKAFRDDLSPRFMSLETAAQYDWSAILSTHLPPENPDLKGPLMIMPHGSGFGIGGNYSDVLAQGCEIYFGHTPQEFTHLQKRLGKTITLDNFVATGCPSIDGLTDYIELEDSRRQALKSELGLNPGLPVILISSHWTPDSLLRTWGAHALEALQPLAKNYSIVQIAHPGIWDSPSFDTLNLKKNVYQQAKKFDSKRLFSTLVNFCADNTALHFLPFSDTQKMLGLADILIGDYSSIIIDYCLLNRPIVFTNRRDRFMLEKNYHRYAAACGAANSLEQLLPAVVRELKVPEQRAVARKTLADTFLWNIGNAAATVVAEIHKRI